MIQARTTTAIQALMGHLQYRHAQQLQHSQTRGMGRLARGMGWRERWTDQREVTERMSRLAGID